MLHSIYCSSILPLFPKIIKRNAVLRAFICMKTAALTFRTKQYSTSYSSDICYGKRFYNDFFLRMTVPLVSYIRSSLRFWYYASLSTCCQNLERKIGVTRKIWEKAGVKLLMDLTEKSVNFSTLATSNIRLLLVFGEDDQ